jgi:hypothetical protein
MPYFIVVGLLSLVTILHVVRTRRPLYWVFIVLAFPMLGALAYLLAEIAPEIVNGPKAQLLKEKARDRLDPERHYRYLSEQADIADTVENRRLLAEEALRLGKVEKALSLYESTLHGHHENDASLLFGLAQASFAHGEYARCIETLDRLRQHHPAFDSANGHLIYARSLEEVGRVEDALIEYEDLAGYYPGEEARCRYGLALIRAGKPEMARQVFGELIRFVDRRPPRYGMDQRQWYEIARQNLR